MNRLSLFEGNSGLKQTLAFFGFVGCAWIANGQGLVSFNNSPNYLITTNSVWGGPATGVTATNVPSYFYGLFVAPSNVVDPAVFVFTGLYATNTSVATGGRFSGGGSVAVPGAAAGTTVNLLIRGWSSNLGRDWNYVLSVTRNPCCQDFWYGESLIATVVLGGFDGTTVRAPATLFGAGPGQIHTNFVLRLACDRWVPPVILTTNGCFGFLTNGFGFSVSGLPCQTVVVEASTNMLSWSALTTNALGGGGLSYFSDPSSSNAASRFYRVKVQ